MKIIKCDRCGKELNPFESNHASVRIRGNFYVIANGLELCGSCKKEAENYFHECETVFSAWLRSGGEKQQPEPEPEPEEPNEP